MVSIQGDVKGDKYSEAHPPFPGAALRNGWNIVIICQLCFLSPAEDPIRW